MNEERMVTPEEFVSKQVEVPTREADPTFAYPWTPPDSVPPADPPPPPNYDEPPVTG